MKTTLSIALIAVLVAACGDTAEILTAPDMLSAAQGKSGVVLVTNSDDDGAGSLRAAIAEANEDAAVRKIQIHPNVGTIEVASTILFDGTQDLEIQGHSGAIDGSALDGTDPIFLATGGGDLAINNLIFQNGPGNGMTVQVPEDADGTQSVTLRSVTARGNDGHGIEINDQEAPEEAGNPDVVPQERPNSNGSDASLRVIVSDCLFEDNGFGALDRDGLRVNEGGPGNLHVTIFRTEANDNGADGIELDERGEGSVVFEVLESHFARNGDFDQVPPLDKDDGMDVDELDGGDLVATLRNSSSNDNFEEGFDFNENDAGDMRVVAHNVETSGNLEEGFDLEEDDDFRAGGSMFATIKQFVANDNGGDGGIKIRERDVGDVNVDIDQSTTSMNVNAGINIREQEAGNLNSVINGATALDNGTAGIVNREDLAGNLTATVNNSVAGENTTIGISFDENDDGNLLANVGGSAANGNGGNGIDADEAGPGNLTAVVSFTATNSNGGHGMNFDENAGGDFNVSVSDSISSSNTLSGIRADQATPGSAILVLTNVTRTGNLAGAGAGNVPPSP